MKLCTRYWEIPLYGVICVVFARRLYLVYLLFVKSVQVQNRKPIKTQLRRCTNSYQTSKPVVANHAFDFACAQMR